MKTKIATIASILTGYTQVAKSDLSSFLESTKDETAVAIGLRSITPDGLIDLTKLDSVYTPQSMGWLKKVAESEVRIGDVIVAARGSSGKSGLVTNTLSGPLFFTNNVLLLRADPARVEPAYLQAYIQNLYSDPNQEALRRGVLGQWSITRSDIEQLEIMLPALAEQKQIAAAFNAIHEARRATQAVSDHYGQLIESLRSQFFKTPTRF